MNSLDPNNVIASTISDLIKASFESVSAKATGAIKDAWDNIFEDFEPFMREAHERNNNLRLLCNKDTDVSLYQVYVQSNFKCGSKIITDDELIYNIREGKNVVINGNGGAGKTFFMRHLWMSLFENPMGFTPLFIELRKINELSTLDVKSFVRRSISRKKELDTFLFDRFCSEGRFCFVLDGYDEVLQSQREELQSQILELSSTFPDCRFVVSSRFEPRFAGWQNFDLYESVPFNLKQVKELVKKVPFHEPSKKLFSKQLDKEFYDENESFLSNPLLAIMMMMTFRENMEIPKRMNIFYDQAFSTLYKWHDATKAFSRKRLLDIDNFQRSFGVFCLLSYYKEKFEFTKTEIVDFIKNSNKICSITVPVEDILHEYVESVNLIKQEGLTYVFIHRSFQEYFAAHAMMRIMPNKFSELLPAIRKRYSDNVLPMCFEMNKGIVIEYYIQPTYQSLLDKSKLTKSNKQKFGCLESSSVVYKCVTRKLAGVRYQKLMGVSIDFDQDVNEFLTVAARIFSSKSSKRELIVELLFKNGVFSSLSSAVDKSQTTRQLSGWIVYFADGEVHVNFRSEEAEEDKTNMRGMNGFLNELRRHEEVFLLVEDGLASQIAATVAWCNSEIKANSKRDKSVDEIFNLGSAV